MLATAIAVELACVLIDGKRRHMILVERAEADEIISGRAQLNVSSDNLGYGIFVFDPFHAITRSGIQFGRP